MHVEPSASLSADVAVVGGGPAGLTAAVALAAAGVDALLAAPHHRTDNRTTALLNGSVEALDALGAWTACREQAAPLRAIRIIDDRAGLLRAPEVTFAADEIGLDAFAWNVENRHLVAALGGRAGQLASLRRVTVGVSEVQASDQSVRLVLADGTRAEARLVVGADGRRSLCRSAAGIAADEWHYPQTALTCNLSHTRDHSDISTEFHTSAGPFTLVPLPGRRSSLVWVAAPGESERLAALDDAELSRAIERRSHSILGKVSVEPGRGVFPLAGLTARPFAAARIALVGEAAHVIPPIGAQGFNLGLRDALAIADLAAQAHRDGTDVGAPTLLHRYDALRNADASGRTVAVDLLNRSLLTDFLPLQAVRGIGLALLGHVGPLRRALLRAGVGPQAQYSDPTTEGRA